MYFKMTLKKRSFVTPEYIIYLRKCGYKHKRKQKKKVVVFLKPLY